MAVTIRGRVGYPWPVAHELELVAPRGYCAGVDRAIETVERVLVELGAPVYVRGEIVHNTHVVATLASKGAVFVDSEHDVPRGETIVLSAHGVSPEVRRVCAERELRVIDATCPLVSKVHAQVRRFASRGATVFLVGHGDHDEVIGTRGEAPESVVLIETVADAERVAVPDPDNVALTTQTTLSVDDTAEIVEVLKRRFPALLGPKVSDICYATQNRQDAVREAVVAGADLVLVVGSRNSSNSNRMVEVARDRGARGAPDRQRLRARPGLARGRVPGRADRGRVGPGDPRAAGGRGDRGRRLRARRRRDPVQRGRLLRPPPRGQLARPIARGG